MQRGSGQLLGEVGDGGEVVGVAILPSAAVEGALGVAFLLAHVGGDEVAVEHLGLPEAQRAAALVGQEGGGDDVLVVQTPGVLVAQGAYAAVEEGPGGVEVAAGLDVLGAACGAEHLGTAFVAGVVVEVADDDDFVRGRGGTESIVIVCPLMKSFSS